jgi:hypothetical protein
MANPEHLKILKQGVKVWNRWLAKNFGYVEKPDLSGADLNGISLDRIDLRGVNLHGANFIQASLGDARLGGANLSQVNLSDAYLNDADLFSANLWGANLSGVSLISANLTDAELANANCLETQMAFTILSNVDLSEVKNLDSVIHSGPSCIGIDTIYKSRGNIPEKFLRGCGVPKDFITYMRSLTGKAIEFYSCFISYSSKDEEFAKRLYADLQNEGVRCWFAPEDLKIGERFRVRIDESIRMHDKLLLVLSENSVASQWVEDEVEAALEKEREQNKTVLFPVRLDGAVMEVKDGWPAAVRRNRHMGDFSEWKSHDSYRKAFERLMRDLKAEARK